MPENSCLRGQPGQPAASARQTPSGWHGPGSAGTSPGFLEHWPSEPTGCLEIIVAKRMHLADLQLQEAPAACSDIHPSLRLLPGHTSHGYSQRPAHSKGAKAGLGDSGLLRQRSFAQGLPDGLADLSLDLGQPKMRRLNLPRLSSWLRVRLASWSVGSPSPSQLLPHVRSQTFLLITSLHNQPPLGICFLEDLD